MRSSSLLIFALVAAMALVAPSGGCERGTPTSTPADAPVEPSPADGDSAGEIQNTTAHPENDAENEGASEDDEDDEPAATDDALTADTALELVTAALDEVLDPYAARIMTPALPPSWPLEGSTVVYWVYPLTPAERGVDLYRTSAPSHRVELDVQSREAAVETIEKPKKLGDYHRPRPKRDDPIIKAEQALLDVAAGRHTAQKVHYLLVGYEQWFEANGTIGADARKRVSAFATWASSWGR